MVVGALDDRGHLRERHLRRLANAVAGMGCHCTFDWMPNGDEALETPIVLSLEHVLNPRR
ncbi:MAG: hypothetical protein NZM43_09400 [Saprospiraceae bacterium]|nr:hypothetical protein [Saprospiraceae bacterium]